MKDIFKRLLIVIHYLTFILGVLFLCVLLSGVDENPVETLLYLTPPLLFIGPSLRYIFLGNFLIFPWSKEKVDK